MSKLTIEIAARVLRERLKEHGRVSKGKAVFRTDGGKEMAIDIRMKSDNVTIWLEDWSGAVPGVSMLKRYDPNEGRSRNLSNTRSPRLAVGNPVVTVQVETLEALNELIDTYSSMTVSTVQDQVPQENKGRNAEISMPIHAKNLILYGPPGTGKTYSTVLKAMSIIDDTEYDVDIEQEKYNSLKKQFDEFKKEGQIEFVTFHQSYGYEDFMQGIRPFTKNGQVGYEVRDGVLKRIAEQALLNWTRSSADSSSTLQDDVSFESALRNLQKAMEAEEDQKVTMTLYGGATTKVSLRPDGQELEFTVPSTGSPWSVTIKKLRALWPRRNEIKVPSDTGGFNGSVLVGCTDSLKKARRCSRADASREGRDQAVRSGH